MDVMYCVVVVVSERREKGGKKEGKGREGRVKEEKEELVKKQAGEKIKKNVERIC